MPPSVTQTPKNRRPRVTETSPSGSNKPKIRITTGTYKTSPPRSLARGRARTACDEQLASAHNQSHLSDARKDKRNNLQQPATPLERRRLASRNQSGWLARGQQSASAATSTINWRGVDAGSRTDMRPPTPRHRRAACLQRRQPTRVRAKLPSTTKTPRRLGGGRARTHSQATQEEEQQTQSPHMCMRQRVASMPSIIAVSPSSPQCVPLPSLHAVLL